MNRSLVRRGVRASVLAALLPGAFVGCTPPQGDTASTQQTAPRSAGSSSAARATSAWDVNDLSVLYPLRRFGSRAATRGLPYLKDGLLTDAQFQGILGSFGKDFKLDFKGPGAQAAVMNKLDSWAVVAIRIQSCARKNAKDPCIEVINLVAQPALSGESTTGDFAMHLTYKPTKGSAALLGEMIRIRNATARNPGATVGKPLGVHPILKEEGLDSKFAVALRTEFLRNNISSRNLVSVATAFVEPKRIQPWVFAFYSARDLSTPTSHSIFMFDPGTSENDCGVQTGRLICRRDASGRIVDSAQKRSANPDGRKPSGFTASGEPYMDDFLTLVQTDPDKRGFPRAKRDLALWRGVFNTLENPDLMAPEQSNCASCHRTQTERVRFSVKDAGGNPVLDLAAKGQNAFVPPAVANCTPGIGIDYGRKGIKTINVRMFGYLHSDPIVTQRVANETLQVCGMLKRSVR